ncbi:SDR family NAD(P)-dependent oxidoreductase [Streptomyces fuscigenes]|uniref:SDR family NAD(P)-dependent oxidoreductase n=1 Tax=Streptomyces fuscigenes TaxID=1528880 RepID=UPI001F17C990|nr:SDR family NAD(P)-dependent oxidoreductase [Streptomyces fuscigenes]MCF3965269.1 SDR family NAD(P)-dependent oxidoreductase [Streptomyces fuscigenes]
MSKVWFLTGSSRGLGRALAEQALASGDRVVATARDVRALDDLVARHGERVRALPLDVTDVDAVHEAVAAGLEAFGRYDVVVNNAGYADLASVEDMSLDGFRRQVDTLFHGVVYVTKAVLPTLRAQGSGHILQVSSLGGRLGSPGLAAYQSAKWAVNGFTTVLAQEVAPLGIRVTSLEPGGMRTDWAGSSMTIPPVSEPYRPTVGAFADMLRGASGADVPTPAEVARVVYDLAGRDDAPVRLLLGKDAVQYAAAAAEALAASDEKWRTVSESVNV